MNQPENRPIVYMKADCPFCLSLKIFLLETKLIDTVQIREFTPGSADEIKIRDELAPYHDSPAFPTLRTPFNIFILGSDKIIQRLASEANIDAGKLSILDAYTKAGLVGIVRLYKENVALKRRVAEIEAR